MSSQSLGETVTTTSVAESARRRIARRLLPYLFFLYIIAYLDRVNLSYASLEMSGALGFTAEIIGFGAGIFFIGYFLLEIPGAILVERWSARAWIARIMISWGIVAMLTGFVHTAHQFYTIRFLLGASEAGFFPGIVVYLSHWFRYEDRAKAMAMFMAAQSISNIIGSPVSGLLLGINWLGLAGWRWLFILEGIPAVLFGIVTIFYLTDRPHQAKWLLEDEKQWISTELEQEKKAKETVRSYSVWDALRQPEVILLSLALFFMAGAVYGFNFWLPTIIKKLSGHSNLFVTTVSALPYCIGLIATLLVGWSSDRTKERRWHAALCMIIASLGLGLSVISHRTDLAVLMFCLAAVGMYGYLSAFWSLPSSFLTGTAAAASIGLINSVGNLGGFFGPYAVGYISKKTHGFTTGVLCLSASALMAGVLVLLLRRSKPEAKT
ncbi:MAG TPA: MFS transporter [Terriglobales bacterium]|jgi:ACS family tartrate transporter-like MFS transporter|nr:MFS transporter [Terriglobales bacterium]